MVACCNVSNNDYTQFVDPFIGTGGHGHTFPGPVMPHGMIQPSPDTRIDGWDACSGYHYTDSLINGFTQNHLSGTDCADYGDFLLMPTVGEQKIDPQCDSLQNRPFASEFSHADEVASPGYYSTLLKSYGIKAEITAANRAAIYRFTYPETDDAGIILDVDYSIQNQNNTDMKVEILSDVFASVVLTTDIGSVTIPRTQKGVFYNMCFPLDEGSNFNNVPLMFTIDTNYFTYQLRLNSRVITNNKFEAGKIYTFNFTLEEKEIRLNTIDISQCTTYNIDSSESLSVIVSPDAVWNQSGNESAQMVFVSLGMSATIDGKDYEVLWATCNIGAMEPIETGFHYAWGEVERKAASLYSPGGYTGTATTDIMNTQYDAVKAYLGEGYWLWRMPTQQMWLDIIKNCNWKWKTVKKATDGGESEDNLNFDASVWEVTKKDADSTIVGLIYLPITGYSGYDEETKTYKKVNKARCHYWTSTPCSDAAGGTAKSWAFQTTYVTESDGTGNGHMTAPVLKECERYNGYCIRPVLLKRKN